jgi:pimeloyl-ACP methyl ester carboxylesterase
MPMHARKGIALRDAARFTPLMRWISLLVLLATGCAHFSQLRRDVTRLHSEGTLRVEVTGARPHDARVLVVVLNQPVPGIVEFSGIARVNGRGEPALFTLPVETDHWVGAFQDDNGDANLDDGEVRWAYPVPCRIGTNYPRVLSLSAQLAPRAHIPPDARAAFQTALLGRTLTDVGASRQVPVEIGTPIRWDDPRVMPAAGTAGLWQPMQSLNSNGLGLYCAGRPNRARTPVIFVHGAAGSPSDFRDCSAALDSRFQAWFFSYPSGLRLDACSLALDRAVQLIGRRHGYTRVHTVAHSMGGLVARDFVLRRAAAANGPRPASLLTVSTPWSGHEAASLGLKYAPVAVPSWRDIAVGSPFITDLAARHLPAQLPHHLAYTHHGRRRVGVAFPNDGAVTVASQLWPPIRTQAASVTAFDQTHTSILHSPELPRWINTLLHGMPEPH